MPNGIFIPFPNHPTFPALEIRFDSPVPDHFNVYHNGWRFLEIACGGGHLELLSAGSLPPAGTDERCLLEVAESGHVVYHGVNG